MKWVLVVIVIIIAIAVIVAISLYIKNKMTNGGDAKLVKENTVDEINKKLLERKEKKTQSVI